MSGRSRLVFSTDVLHSMLWLGVLLHALLSQHLPGPAVTVLGKMTSARGVLPDDADFYL